MLAKIGAQVPPLTGGKWLTALAFPLMGGWIAATTTSKTDVFGGPFPVLLYLLVVGIAVLFWGVMTTRIYFPHRGLHRLISTVALEEVAAGIAFYLLFVLLT